MYACGGSDDNGDCDDVDDDTMKTKDEDDDASRPLGYREALSSHHIHHPPPTL